jgi:acetyl esterase/lipase
LPSDVFDAFDLGLADRPKGAVRLLLAAWAVRTTGPLANCGYAFGLAGGLAAPARPNQASPHPRLLPPALATTLPVWIHGGMFRKGSGSEASYRGISFARDGVVCVTINCRLAAEGFLYLDDSTANLGLLD